jgi:protein involved in polysaccharide export with SLBB domain
MRQSPRVRAWRGVAADVDVVTVTWRHKDDGDIRFTVSPAGQVTIPAEAFVAAVRQLDRELMVAMQLRITDLEATGPQDGVEIDVAQVRTDHQARG